MFYIPFHYIFVNKKHEPKNELGDLHVFEYGEKSVQLHEE